MEIHLETVRPTRTGHIRLLPNINVSARALPATVSAGDFTKNDKLDHERPTRKLTDREIYSFVVEISPQEWIAYPDLMLEVSFNPALFRVLRASGIPLPSPASSPVIIDLAKEKKLSTKARGLQFFLEALTFWGSPLIEPGSSPRVSFRILDAQKTVLLARYDGNGPEVRTADLVLLGDDAKPERIFMCDLEENQPSVREVRRALDIAGVPLTLVPLDVGNGDSWLQDQFQVGYTATPEGSQTVLLHLPRLHNDSALFAGTPNLRNFVDTHFPSRNIGVVKDFWRTKIEIEDGTSAPLSLEIGQSYVLYKHLLPAPRLLQGMFSLMREIDSSSKPGLPPGGSYFDLFLVRQTIESVHTKLLGYRNLTAEQNAKVLSIKPILARISQILNLKGGNVVLSVRAEGRTQDFVYSAENSMLLRDLFGELTDLHSSRNYGGNIEVSPPLAGAPYGKIFAGSITSKPLRNFLTSRGGLHPFVEVNTEWLDVGHIDEIAAFASRGEGDFCILRAAPQLGIDMLDQLVDCQAKGIQVTRLFRGKKWVHESEPGATDPLLPPATYRRLLLSKRYDLSGFKTGIPHAPKPTFGHAVYHDDRRFLIFNQMTEVKARYAAMITCADLRDICRATNRDVEELFLTKSTYNLKDDRRYQPYLESEHYRQEVMPRRLDKVLEDQFPGKAVYPLPILFDWVQDFLHSTTAAIMPGMVNLQTLGTHVLVPRPLGPRMPVADAVTFVTNLLKKLGYPKTKIDENFVRSRGLDKTWHWTRPQETVHRASLRQMPTNFDPQFLEYMLSLQVWSGTNSGYPPVDNPDNYTLFHRKDPLSNHPEIDYESLRDIAVYFKDGFPQFKNIPVDFCNGDTEQAHPKFDKFETDLKSVMDQIKRANPGIFGPDDNVIPEKWTRIVIPEDTADVFEVYTQVLLESLGLKVHWVDSWFYHTHFGGIHCGTNVLRSPASPT